MATTIPDDLIKAVQEGRGVLFLGAGASRGSKNSKGEPIPLANDLAAELISNYLSPEYDGYDFRGAYDLSCSQRDVLTVQRFIWDRLSPFLPADFHLKIPLYPWAGLVTTNYDLIIERAYTNCLAPIQSLIANVKDDDGAARKLTYKSVLYVKLHGCITRHNEVHPPLIASTEQLIAFREGRQNQFATFLEWAKTKTIVFCGYSFNDSNLRIILDEIIKEGDNRPRHYIVSPNVLPAVASYWSDRRVTAVSVTFEQLIDSLDGAIPPSKRKLALLSAGSVGATPFTKFITKSTTIEPSIVSTYIGSLIEQIYPEFEVPLSDPKLFYKGFNQGWFPIQADLDVAQSVVSEMLTDRILTRTSTSGVELAILKGHAGSGKTIALRRLTWDSAKKYGKLCFYVSREQVIEVDRFRDIFALTDIPIYLFIDNISEHQRPVLELINVAARERASLCIIGTESFNIWNTTCESLEPFVNHEYEMRYLSENGIVDLISKLEKHGCLGYLQALSEDRRRYELRHEHGRQILVALLEATNGMPLVEIIAKEYQGIHPPEARLLYLDVCSLHRFGPPVRAGIISRIHKIELDDFSKVFFRPLEQIVKVKRDPKSGDFAYEARHPHIARLVYEAALPSEDGRFDNLIRIISKLNPSFSYDADVLSQIVRAENIERTLSDHSKGRSVYELALNTIGRKAVILHQRGIFEFHIATNAGQLNVAEEYLAEALRLEPNSKSIKHSLAELDLRRSRMAIDPVERQAWRRRAEQRASALTAGDTSSYPYHTLLKAAIDEVKDALAAVSSNESETSVLRLGEAIQRAEAALQRGLTKFPNESRLLGEEGNLSQALADAGRAEAAFKKAFQANPKSALLAKRLVRIFRAKGAWKEAQDVLRQAIEQNAGSQELHFEMAMVIMEEAADADQREADQVLYHLRRSFVVGDKSYQSQFWYARQLALMDKFDDAKPLFERLASIRAPYRTKSEVRGIVRETGGAPKRFYGSVLVVKNAYALVQCGEPNLRAFVLGGEVEGGLDMLAAGARVSFELGFNLRGAVAIKLQRLS